MATFVITFTGTSQDLTDAVDALSEGYGREATSTETKAEFVTRIIKTRVLDDLKLARKVRAEKAAAALLTELPIL